MEIYWIGFCWKMNFYILIAKVSNRIKDVKRLSSLNLTFTEFFLLNSKVYGIFGSSLKLEQIAGNLTEKATSSFVYKHCTVKAAAIIHIQCCITLLFSGNHVSMRCVALKLNAAIQYVVPSNQLFYIDEKFWNCFELIFHFEK